MELIEWNVDDMEQTVDSLDDFALVKYNALLVRNMEEYLSDAEVYVLTWDGEASDGGNMFKLNAYGLEKIIDGTIFGGSSEG